QRSRSVALLQAARAEAFDLVTAAGAAALSPRHEASWPAPMPISFVPFASDDLPPVQMQRHLRSFAADPYRHQRGIEPVGEGDTCDSWFRDQLLLAEARHRAEQALESPVLRGRDIGDIDAPWADQDLDRAKERLRVARALGERELRDLTTTLGAPFVPAGG